MFRTVLPNPWFFDYESAHSANDVLQWPKNKSQKEFSHLDDKSKSKMPTTYLRQMQFGESKFFEVLLSLYFSSSSLDTTDILLAPKVDLFLLLLKSTGTSTSAISSPRFIAGTAGGLWRRSFALFLGVIFICVRFCCFRLQKISKVTKNMLKNVKILPKSLTSHCR